MNARGRARKRMQKERRKAAQRESRPIIERPSLVRAFMRGFRIGQDSLLLGAAIAQPDGEKLVRLMRTIRSR